MDLFNTAEKLKAKEAKKEKEEKLNKLKIDTMRAARAYNKYLTVSFMNKFDIKTLFSFIHPTDRDEFYKRFFAIY